jgi:hypothetical protein
VIEIDCDSKDDIKMEEIDLTLDEEAEEDDDDDGDIEMIDSEMYYWSRGTGTATMPIEIW